MARLENVRESFKKWLTSPWSSYCALLVYIILLVPIYAFLIPHNVYANGNSARAIILAFLCGGLVGVTEIASRYRDEQLKAVWSPDGLVYILFNGAISSFALVLILHFRGTTPPFTTFKSTLVAAIAAGFGATAIMRTRLAVIKGSDNKEISIGPDIVINLLLSMIDRRIDRWRATKRQQIVAKHLSALISLGSIDQATQYLFGSFLAFQNLSDSERQQITDRIEANKKTTSDLNVQFQALGFLFLTAVGEENFEIALEKAKQMKEDAKTAMTETKPSVVPRATKEKIAEVDSVAASYATGTPPQLQIDATGKSSSAGWAEPEIVARVLISPPSDGIYEYEFVAKPPAGVGPSVSTPISAKLITSEIPKGIKGVRITSQTNNKEVKVEVPDGT